MSQDLPIVVAFGGGTNSTAMLCGFRERGIVPSLICFADTGGEMPHTYEHVAEMDAKCREWWGIGIETVRKTYKGAFETLEEQCLRTKQLPSLAYGYKQCSIHFKSRPQNARQKSWAKENGHAAIFKAVGFGADELYRIKPQFDKVQDGPLLIISRYYLVEWRWGRSQCVDAITRQGLKQPGKSACFFCPSRNAPRVVELNTVRPDLVQRGIAMESNAATKTARNGSVGVVGLNFGLQWSEILRADAEQMKLFEWIGEHASPAQPCGCVDG